MPVVTLKDIAQEANVSVMTVSNVVNGNLSKVSKEKAAQIQEIIRRRNYVQNASARNLAKANSNIVAIMLRNIGNENALSGPHNAALVGQMIRLLQEGGFYAMVSLVENKADIAKTLRAWNVRGAVFLGMFDDEIEQIYAASKAPMVFVDSYSNVRRICSVGIDDYRGGRLAARCLIDHGHVRLAFAGPAQRATGVIQQRLAGFMDELTAHGLSLEPKHRIVVESDNDPQAISAATDALCTMAGSITGVFVTSDQLAMGLMGALAERGISIPRDMSIIGFDNIPVSGQIYPPLTTIGQCLEQKATLAIEILQRQIECRDTPAEVRVLDVELIERATVFAPRT